VTEPVLDDLQGKTSPVYGRNDTSRIRRRVTPLAALATILAGALIVAPFGLSTYNLNLLIITGITALPVSSLVMLFGYAGQVSLGQAAFYGAGAYIYANMTVKQGLSPWIAMASAVVLTALFAYLVGRGLLRLRGYYLAMVTAALGVITVTCFSNLPGLTGGYSGITGIPSISLPGIAFDSQQSFYYVILVITAATLVGVRMLASGEYGRMLKAMRESETVSSAYGIPIAHAKAQVFALSAGLAALGGCLFAQYVQYVSPDNFTPALSILLFLGAVIGGLSSVWGAVLGAAYVVVLPELVSGYSDFEVAITGVITLVILVFAPRGVASLVGRLGRETKRIVTRKSHSGNRRGDDGAATGAE